MNGAGRLPKVATEYSEVATASAVGMKQWWWKYSQSAQRVSPPPRLLLVVLLCAQILFLAIVRLGPSASIWGAGAGEGTGSSSQASSSMSYPALRGNVLHIASTSDESREFLDEESMAASSALDVMRLSDDPSSPASNQEEPKRKQKPSFKRISMKQSLPSLKEEKDNVPSLHLTALAAEQKSKRVPDIIEPFDDLLPSVDYKALLDPASKGASPLDSQDKFSDAAKDASQTDTFRSTMDKEGGHEDSTSADVVDDTTATFSSLMKAQINKRMQDELDENAGTGSESADGKEAQTETEQVLFEKEASESASIIEERGLGESREKGQQASLVEKSNEAGSKADVDTNLVKQEVDAVSTEEASEKGTFEEQKVQEKVLRVEEPQAKISVTGIEHDSVKEEPQDIEETQAKISEMRNERVPVKEEQLALIEQKVGDETTSSECSSGYIYVYDLPPIFNRDIISNCTALNPWLDVCATLSNGGLGESLGEASPLGQIGSWYTSDQFTAEIVFHNRMLQHPCLTDKMEFASGFYVPFYAGLDVGRYLSSGASAERRDMLSNQFLDWLVEQPAWKKSGGSDHFIMIGRMTWDFRRSKDEDWGSSFFCKPAMQNTTKLLIERNPWDNTEMAVPYPTNFHPQSDSDLVAWQNHLRGLKRNSLFSFAGAPRDRFPDDFRGILFKQCQQTKHCRSLDCSNRTCDDNQKTLELFMDSTFCLQPRGDSFTRRSTFDCLLAGSVPVFFWHRSAYMQYKWHLPADEASYSVFISKEDMRNGTKIKEVLKALEPEKVQSMQEAVIRLLPRVVYAVSGFSLTEKDAFDVAIEGVMRGLKESRLSSQR